MGVEGVDGESDELRVERLEIVDHGREGHELGGAHGGEVGGVGEQDYPFPFVVGREVDLSLGGVRAEGRSIIVDERHPLTAFYVIVHLESSCSLMC